MNHDDGQQDQKRSEAGSPPLKERESQPEAHRADNPADSRKESYWKDRGFTRVLEVIIALAAIVTAVVAYYQWQAMQATNALTANAIRAAHDANRLTSEALGKSKRQFDLARSDAADEAAEDERRFERSFTQSKSDAAVEQGLTRESLTESREALEISQRARVGVERLENLTLTEGEKPISVRLKNSGNTPASEVHAVIGWRLQEMPLPEDFPIVAEGKVEPAPISLPAGHGVTIFASPPPHLTALGAERIRDGAVRLYMFGRITYRDVFGRRRETRFCALHEKTTEFWTFCPFGNWAD